MDVDAAPALKRKGADASELWLDDDGGPGFPVGFRAAKSRRLDADVPPVVPGAVVPPPPPAQAQPVAGFGVVEAAPVSGDLTGMKRKAADAPELWLDAFHASATKSRRLDADDVPPVVPGAVVPPPSLQTQPVVGFGVAEAAPVCGDVAVVPVDVATGGNEERAIVLYRPAEAARSLLLGPLRPGAPLRVSPDWIHGLKGTIMQEASSHRALFAGDENSNLAMVPWAPSRVQAWSTAATATEMMDDEDTSMDVEQDNRADQLSTTHQLPQPQQQHCMVHQPVPAASYQPSPVTWSW